MSSGRLALFIVATPSTVLLSSARDCECVSCSPDGSAAASKEVKTSGLGQERIKVGGGGDSDLIIGHEDDRSLLLNCFDRSLGAIMGGRHGLINYKGERK